MERTCGRVTPYVLPVALPEAPAGVLGLVAPVGVAVLAAAGVALRVGEALALVGQASPGVDLTVEVGHEGRRDLPGLAVAPRAPLLTILLPRQSGHPISCCVAYATLSWFDTAERRTTQNTRFLLACVKKLLFRVVSVKNIL